MMEIPVKQTFMWFVLLLAFVVKGSNLEATVDNFVCFPLHTQTFYLRSVLKHQSIHLRKCGMVFHSWMKSFKSCVSVQLLLLFPRGCVEQTFPHVSSFQIFVKNLMTRLPVDVQLILSFRVSRLLLSTSSRSSATAPWIHVFDDRPLLGWYWRPSRPSLNLWKHSKTRIRERERPSFPRTVWSIWLFLHVFSCVLNKRWLFSCCFISTEKQRGAATYM